jgi:LPS O-antigen subunit length determinant protein (WzzB/FepE family)
VGYRPMDLWLDTDYVKETLAWQADQDEAEREALEQDAQERGRYMVDPVRFPAQTSRRLS